MKKKLYDIPSWIYIQDYDDRIFEDCDEDGYFKTDKDYEWWASLANAHSVIRDFEESLSRDELNAFEEYKEDYMIAELADDIENYKIFLLSDGDFGEEFDFITQLEEMRDKKVNRMNKPVEVTLVSKEDIEEFKQLWREKEMNKENSLEKQLVDLYYELTGKIKDIPEDDTPEEVAYAIHLITVSMVDKFKAVLSDGTDFDALISFLEFNEEVSKDYKDLIIDLMTSRLLFKVEGILESKGVVVIDGLAKDNLDKIKNLEDLIKLSKSGLNETIKH